MELLKPVVKNLGEFTVRRILPSIDRKLVGPFIFFDHMGPAEFKPGAGVNVRPHPHIGLSTVTYLFDGVIVHRDTLGYEQPITSKAVNWMTAGRGIAHSERTPTDLVSSGSRLHGIQAWLALPKEKESIAPSFEHYPAALIPEKDLNGISIRVIAGELFGLLSPVLTASPTCYVELKIPDGASITIPPAYDELALYVVTGKIAVGTTVVESGEMLTLDADAEATVNGIESARVMLLGGSTIEGERHLWWNFVSSSQAQIEKAKRDWKTGKFGSIAGDSEFIPLPD